MAYIGGSKSGFTYYDSGSQRHSRGSFLLLACDHSDRMILPGGDDDRPEVIQLGKIGGHRYYARLYGCVRTVALEQLGHFMMGTARVGGQRIVVSGAYGSDGLPLDWDGLTSRARRFFIPVPPKASVAYWQGNGWSGAGSEYDTLAKWARSL